jgi:hypothetical protein
LASKAARFEDEGADGNGLLSVCATLATATATIAAGIPGERLATACSAGFDGFAGNARLVLLLASRSSVAGALADGSSGGGTAAGICGWFNLEAGAPVPERAFAASVGVPLTDPAIRAASRTAFCVSAILK